MRTIIWAIYNCIRNVEITFRCLKTDLNLRPIYRKTDDAIRDHFTLGLLAYRLLNTIRYQLQQKDIKSEWRELVRTKNSQKCITTTIQYVKEQWIGISQCSEPEDKVKRIYDALKYKYASFIRKKSVVPKPIIKKRNTLKIKVI